VLIWYKIKVRLPRVPLSEPYFMHIRDKKRVIVGHARNSRHCISQHA
jgi:hypothetical protein